MSSSSKSRRPGSCMSCRYRKVRCDGAQPTCGQCQLIPNGEEDCEYRDALGTKTNIELLEDNIARLETKIRQLESQDDPPPDDAILLSMPYTTSQARQTTSLTAPTSEDRVNCLRNFVENCTHLSFFLHIGRFKETVTSSSHGPHTLGPAILNAACLWGARISPHGLPHLEMYFLHKTLTDLSGGPRSDQEGRSTLQAIQVQVLLSLYYMDAGKMLRAGYYASTALSLANSSNLSCLGTSPALSQDPIEQFERVQAFWTCLILSAHFISHGPTALKCPSKNLGSVTTPWPTELANDSAVQFKDEAVIQMYMDGQPDSASSPKAQLAKNSILYVWSTNLCPKGKVAVQVNCTQVQALETLISRAISLLPDATAIASDPDLTLAQAFIQAATIRRCYASHDRALRDRCFSMAFDVADTVKEAVSQGQWKIVNPIIWPLYMLCLEVLKTHQAMSTALETVAGRNAQDSARAVNVMNVLFDQFADHSLARLGHVPPQTLVP